MVIEKYLNKLINADMQRIIGRYLVSGGCSVIAQFGVLTLFVEQLQIDPTLSSATGFVAGCLVNYLMLYYWTFNSNGKHIIVAAKYTLVTTFTLLLNILIFWTLTEPLKIWYLYSQVVATGAVAMINFLINRRYTFTTENSQVSMDSNFCEQEQEIER